MTLERWGGYVLLYVVRSPPKCCQLCVLSIKCPRGVALLVGGACNRNSVCAEHAGQLNVQKTIYITKSNFLSTNI